MSAESGTEILPVIAYWLLMRIHIASHHSDVGPSRWCEANKTLSQLLHYTTWSFLSMVLSQSSASMGSTECKKVGGLIL
jgi:hypothetical protein